MQTNPFPSQIAQTKLKEALIFESSAKRSLKNTFDDRSPCEYFQVL